MAGIRATQAPRCPCYEGGTSMMTERQARNIARPLIRQTPEENK